MAFPDDALPMRVRIAPGADLTDMPSSYPWQDVTNDVSFRRSGPITLTVGQADEQQEGESGVTLSLRNHESRVVDANGDPWVEGAEVGAPGRYTTDNPQSDLYPGWALGCPVEIAVDPSGTDDWQVRAVQFLNTATEVWPNSNGPTDNLCFTEADLAGLLVRLQAKKDARSASYRTLLPTSQANAFTVFGSTYRYWPMEQPNVSSVAQRSWPSAFPGYPDAQSRVAFGGAIDGPAGSLATPLFVFPSGEGQTGLDVQWELPDSSTGSGLGNQWSIGWTFRGQLGDTPHPVMRRFNVYLRSGTWGAALSGSSYLTDICVLIYANHDGTAFVVGSGSTGIDFSPALAGTIGFTSFTTYPYLNLWDGEAHGIQLTMQQALVGVVSTLYVDGVIVATSGPVAGTLSHPFKVECRGSGGTLGGTAVDNAGSSVGIGHFYYAPQIGLLQSSWAAVGYPGEDAHTRIERLCTEEGVPVDIATPASVAMGPQLVGALVPLLRECEKTDRGILDDSLGYVRYFGIADLVNQDTPALTLAGTSGQIYGPLAPVTDDSRARNDVTATRPGGLPQRVSDEAHAAKVGRYTEGPSFNVETDAGALSQAGWSVHIGTAGDGNAKRYPAVTVDLMRSPELIDDWLALTPGDLLRRTGLPRAHAPGPVDGLVRGWTETYTSRRLWVAQLNTVPYAPYEVFKIEGAGSGHRSRGRLDTGKDAAGTETPPGLSDTRIVVSGIDTDDTSFLMLNRGRPADWTTDGADFPLDLNLEGEQVSVSAIADKWLDAFGRTVAAGSWGSADTGNAYTLVGTAANFAVGSGVGSITCGASASDRIAYQTGLGIGGDQIARLDVRASSGSALPLNSSGYRAGLVLRRDSVTGDHYRITLFVNSTTGAMNISFSKNVGGVTSTITTVALPWTFALNTWYRIVAHVVGTTIKARIWPRDDAAGTTIVPGWPTWQLDTTDASIAASATTDRIGVIARVDDGSTTNVFQFDNARLLSPQLVTVSARSVNSVTKAHAVGSDVRLWRPAAYALSAGS